MPILLALVSALLLCAPEAARTPASVVNFGHLNHLTERIAFGGDSVAIVHIYANYPGYEWISANESGPEGIACVDDAARAAVVYLRHWELRRDTTSRERGRELLKFVMAMQSDDGEFCNFILGDHRINATGGTSRKSFGWWAGRGVWSMALGYRMFRTADPAFAARLRRGVDRALPHVDTLLERYGQSTNVHGCIIPRWLLYESGADASSELALGLIEYYHATGDLRAKGMIEKLARGFMLMQEGDAAAFPFGLHRSWETMWHMWGNSQSDVLARAGSLFADTAMIASAEREAVGFYPRLLIDGLKKEINIAAPGEEKTYEQIAYGIRPATLALLRLYDATHKREYLTMAGLYASWFFGNNALGVPMYDPASGRCFDGISDSVALNRNSGAESTVEALLTLTELEQYPQAMRFLHCRKSAHGQHGADLYAIFSDGVAGNVVLVLDTRRSAVRILQGNDAALYRKEVQ